MKSGLNQTASRAEVQLRLRLEIELSRGNDKPRIKAGLWLKSSVLFWLARDLELSCNLCFTPYSLSWTLPKDIVESESRNILWPTVELVCIIQYFLVWRTQRPFLRKFCTQWWSVKGLKEFGFLLYSKQLVLCESILQLHTSPPVLCSMN